MSKWRSMKTAPKDGTTVRLKTTAGETFNGYWDAKNMFRGWSMNERDVVFEDFVTHWRPEDGR